MSNNFVSKDGVKAKLRQDSIEHATRMSRMLFFEPVDVMLRQRVEVKTDNLLSSFGAYSRD